MKVMLLAAGEGRRMAPLTNKTPKPLLPIGDTTLIERWIADLARAGFSDIVINVWHLADQIVARLGNGERYGVSIQYSLEPELLETGGGIKRALSMLGEEDFLVISSDVYSEFNLRGLPDRLNESVQAHLVLVNNPEHHREGDFALEKDGTLSVRTGSAMTYSGIGVYSPRLFESSPEGPFKLRLLMDRGISQGQLTGEYYEGFWQDIGTIERYEALRHRING